MNENITIPNPLPTNPPPSSLNPQVCFAPGPAGSLHSESGALLLPSGAARQTTHILSRPKKGNRIGPKKVSHPKKGASPSSKHIFALRSAHHVRRCGSRDVAWQLLVARGGPNHPGCREPRGPQVGTSGAAPAVEDGPIHTQPVAADGEWPQAARVRGGVQEPLPRLRRAASRPRLPRQAQRQHLGLGSRPAERLP